jgi:hypothetical protein
LIYFIRRPSDGFIKIGTTKCLSQRLKSLASIHGKGLTVLAVRDGQHAEERSLHGQFKLFREDGEWFRPSEELLLFIITDCKPWDGKDERSSVMVLQMRGSNAWKDWVQSLADHEGVSVPSLFGRVSQWYAKEIEFNEPMPRLR